MSDNRTVDSVNRTMASSSGYAPSKQLGIKKTDEETRNVISNTFGQYIKNNLEAFWYSVGLNANVNIAYQNAMTDPNQCIEKNNMKFYPHPGVGNMQPYNESGNPSGGVFTMQAMG